MERERVLALKSLGADAHFLSKPLQFWLIRSAEPDRNITEISINRDNIEFGFIIKIISDSLT